MPPQEQYDQAGDWQEKGQATDGVLLQVLQYEQTEAVNAVTVEEGEWEEEEELQLEKGMSTTEENRRQSMCSVGRHNRNRDGTISPSGPISLSEPPRSRNR